MLRADNVQWDGLDAKTLRERLGVPRVELHAEVESTQDVAHELAQRGAEAGTIVLADAQRMGRGRMGRSWSSAAGRGVWCTIIERPADLHALDVLSLRVGLLLAERLDAFASDTVRVKWPNDLLIADRKVAGILVEARWNGPSVAWVAIGIGVNTQPPAVVGATGLSEENETQRGNVLVAVVGAVRQACGLSGWLTEDELARYNARDLLRGRRVVSPGTGTVKGIAPSGALIIEASTGVEQHRAGSIEFAEDM